MHPAEAHFQRHNQYPTTRVKVAAAAFGHAPAIFSLQNLVRAAATTAGIFLFAMSSISPLPQPRQGSSKGQFRNGVWFCDCKPPLPARLRFVIDDTYKNKGKQFYGCPVNEKEGNRCTMFVLIDEAKRRQWECFKSSGRSEKRQTTILESFSLSKTKLPQCKGAPVMEVVDLETLDNESKALMSAATLTSNPVSPVGNQFEPSSSVETSTLKENTESPHSELGDIFGATAIEGESERALESCAAINSTLKRIRTTDTANGLPTPSRTNMMPVARLLFQHESNRTDATSTKRKRVGSNEPQESEIFGPNLSILLSAPASPNTSPANMWSEIMDLFRDVDMTTETREAVQKALSIFEDRYAALQARVSSLENGQRRAKGGL
ncbi:hypothetical protein F5B22DRAFT_643055 [Xylaria bambusicola]|uniref:uncharacterized protein n=1 Tax=Xylaria bambusicola TaxID=326684 RepID=UPI002007A80E|nr:uncharacterized protein F5B22DRAFT_643055 [Xylaria bambusicola]KAI0523948.1 hypothetical protein F5B22DRAFT_643055 [Xylaria bambusicola]